MIFAHYSNRLPICSRITACIDQSRFRSEHLYTLSLCDKTVLQRCNLCSGFLLSQCVRFLTLVKRTFRRSFTLCGTVQSFRTRHSFRTPPSRSVCPRSCFPSFSARIFVVVPLFAVWLTVFFFLSFLFFAISPRSVSTLLRICLCTVLDPKSPP